MNGIITGGVEEVDEREWDWIEDFYSLPSGQSNQPDLFSLTSESERWRGVGEEEGGKQEECWLGAKKNVSILFFDE